MKRPLVAVVSCYTLGLLLGTIFQPPLAALFSLSFLVLVLVFVREKFRPFLLCALLTLAGWINLTGRVTVVSPNDLRALLGDNGAIATVRGTLAETPHLKISGSDDQPVEHSLARVRVVALRRGAGWQPADGSIMVMTPGVLDRHFFAGQPVEIYGVLERPPSPLAEGLFDYREYLQTRGIFYQLKTGSTNDWRLGAASRADPPLTDRFLDWSRRTLALGLPAEDEPLRLLWARGATGKWFVE